jgi:hypothetical protein
MNQNTGQVTLIRGDAQGASSTRYWLDVAILITVSLILVIFAFWAGDRVGWEGDDLASMFGISYLDMVGRHGIYKYAWQPLSYELSHWISDQGLRYLDLTYLSNILGMVGIGLLIGLAYISIGKRVPYALFTAILLCLAIPEMWITSLYFNSTAMALPFIALSMHLLQQVRSPRDNFLILASGLLFGVTCMLRMDFATTALFMLVMIHLILPKSGYRPYIIWLCGAAIAPCAMLVSSQDILFQMINITNAFSGSEFSWSFALSMQVFLVSLGPAIVIVPVLLVSKSALAAFARTGRQNVLLISSFLPMLAPIMSLYSGKYLVPLFCCLIWLTARFIGQRADRGELPRTWNLRVYFSGILMTASFLLNPIPSPWTGGTGLISRITGLPVMVATHDGFRSVGNYLYLVNSIRSQNERYSNLRVFSGFAQLLDGCSKNVTVVYPQNENSRFYDWWNWGFMPLHLSSRGWKLRYYDPTNEALLSSSGGGRLLRIVSHQRRALTTDIKGHVIDVGSMLRQPVDIPYNSNALQNEVEDVLEVIEEIRDSGVCEFPSVPPVSGNRSEV